MVPYLKLPASNNNKIPIASITVGPGPEQILTVRSLDLFMKKHGYEIEIKKSLVPFRN